MATKKTLYPLNLWQQIFGKTITEKDLPKDAEKTAEAVLSFLPKRQRAIVECRLKDKKTWAQIVEEFGCGITSVQEQYAVATQNISTHFRNIMLCGWDESMKYYEQNPADKPLVLTGLEFRPINKLAAAGIHTVGDLLSITPEELTEDNPIGNKTLSQASAAMLREGYVWGIDPLPQNVNNILPQQIFDGGDAPPVNSCKANDLSICCEDGEETQHKENISAKNSRHAIGMKNRTSKADKAKKLAEYEALGYTPEELRQFLNSTKKFLAKGGTNLG